MLITDLFHSMVGIFSKHSTSTIRLSNMKLPLIHYLYQGIKDLFLKWMLQRFEIDYSLVMKKVVLHILHSINYQDNYARQTILFSYRISLS